MQNLEMEEKPLNEAQPGQTALREVLLAQPLNTLEKLSFSPLHVKAVAPKSE